MEYNRVRKQDILFYQQNGYLQLPHFFNRQEMAALSSELDQVVASKRPRILGTDREHDDDMALVFKQLVNLWVDSPAIRAFSLNPELAHIACQLAQAQHVVLYHDQALIKPGGEQSRATNWHQDQPYYPMQQQGALTVWIAVDDVSINNGCLQFIPGSQKYGCLEPVPFDREDASIIDRLNPTERSQMHSAVTMEMAAGGVSFHHGCTFHYATPNLSSQPRRAFAIIYVPDYVTYDGGWDAGGETSLQVGDPFGGPRHPILASKRVTDAD